MRITIILIILGFLFGGMVQAAHEDYKEPTDVIKLTEYSKNVKETKNHICEVVVIFNHEKEEYCEYIKEIWFRYEKERKIVIIEYYHQYRNIWPDFECEFIEESGKILTKKGERLFISDKIGHDEAEKLMKEYKNSKNGLQI